MSNGLKRFPGFGRELKREYPVHEVCYDCAEFYDGCNAWPASKPIKTLDGKHLRCLDFLSLPDVMPGTHGQVFPPSRMGGRKSPRELSDTPTPTRPARSTQVPTHAVQGIDPKRQCVCGAPLRKRKRYCDRCREARRREAMDKFKNQHPDRPHRVSGGPQDATERPPEAVGDGAIVNGYYGATPLPERTKALHEEVLARG